MTAIDERDTQAFFENFRYIPKLRVLNLSD